MFWARLFVSVVALFSLNFVAALDLQEAKDIFRNAPEKEKNYDFTIGYRYAYDQNVSRLPEVATSEQSDHSQTVFARLSWRKFFAQSWDMLWRSQLSRSAYNDLKSNNQFWQHHSLNVGWSGEAWNWRFPFSYSNSKYDHKHFADIYQLAPTATRQLGQMTFLQLFYRYQQSEYALDNVSVIDDYSGKTRAFGGNILWHAVPEKLFIRFGGQLGKTDAIGNNWDKAFYSVYSQLRYQVTPQLQAGMRLAYKKNTYDHVHNRLGLKRETRTQSAALELIYHTDSNYELGVRGQWQRSEGNATEYTYDRKVLSVTLARHF